MKACNEWNGQSVGAITPYSSEYKSDVIHVPLVFVCYNYP